MSEYITTAARRVCLGALTALALWGCSSHETSIDLAGEWSISYDGGTRTATVKLPGSMTTNGLGDEIGLNTPWTGQIVDSSFFKAPEYARYREAGNIKVPFWLQPEKYYRGNAIYTREVDIPESWNGKQIELELERCHWITEVEIDGKKAGTRTSLATPHIYNLSELLTPGHHTIKLTVDNSLDSIDPGINSHSVTDHTQGNWNGVVGKMELRARDRVNIARTKVFPDAMARKVRVETYVDNATGATVQGTIAGKIGDVEKRDDVTLQPGVNKIETEFTLGADAPLWDEFNPQLLTLTQELKGGDMKDRRTTEFGLRSIEARDGKILVNGRPVFLRGTLDCAAFPLTGYPPTDEASWNKIYDTLKAHGLNHVRFHSWCPPEAAFASADRKGVYLQVECGSWANTSTSIGDGHPIDRFIAEESQAIADAYGNHPSFVMMTYGNEPAGNGMVKYLTDFVEGWKARDARRIYSVASGWPNVPESQYLVDPTPRIQGWGQGLWSVINSRRPAADFTFNDYTSRYNQPIVSHEIGQWCVYPNFNEIEKYTGVMKPRNMEIFRQTLADAGLAHLADSFLMASGKLQTLCYKADIEAALRSKDMDGFQLLGLEDFPGQGTALVGVLDAFYEPKPYVTAAEYSRFCNTTVPLAHLPRMIFTTADTLRTPVSVAHFGAADMEASVPATWSLTDADGGEIASGNFRHGNLPAGSRSPLGDIEVALAGVKAPAQLRLTATVGDNANDWNIWVYPRQVAPAAEIMMTDRLDAKSRAELAKGGKVLLSVRKGEMTDSLGGDVANGFSSIFWNTAWTGKQAPHTLGVLVDPAHPALSQFPTAYHSDYQWWDAMTNSSVVKLAKVAPQVRPIVRVIDDWFTNRPLGLVFEVRAGGGKLLVSGIDFWQDMENRPEARQLLKSITDYMASPAFNPAIEADIEKIASIVKSE